MDDVERMSVKDLRQLISRAGLSSTDCLEKADLVARAKQAALRLADSPDQSAASASDGSKTLGGYECRLVGDLTKPVDAVVIILHGFGATNGDFIPLSEPLSRALSPRNLFFVFPQAVADARCMGATAWWELNIMKWIGAAQAGKEGMAQLMREKPNGLDACRENMLKLVREAREMANTSNVIIGGFSQGAMTAMDVALQLPIMEQVSGVLMFSGAPIVVDEWSQQLSERRGKDKHSKVRVLLTHGKNDQMLPFACSQITRDLLTKGGADVTYETHNGGHELGGEAIVKAVVSFLKAALKK